MEKLLIKGARLIDPLSQTDAVQDLLLCDGKIAKTGPSLIADDANTADMHGKTIFPGFIDLHVHLRTPGQEAKETIASGGAAAAHGGVTALLSMPNTKPPIDSVELYQAVTEQAALESPVEIFQAAAITRGMEGKKLVDMDGFIAAGVRAFSEDGKSVLASRLLREAMLLAKKHDIPLCEHCEDPSLAADGVLHDGDAAKRLGLPGIPSLAEDVMTARDCLLALETGAHLHVCHVSTKRSVEIIRAAKKAGGHITAEACPHHFILCDEDIPEDDGIWKVNPPLRTKEDVEALREAISDGTIDCISTDHAPHTLEEKAGTFLSSPFGMSGLEFSAVLTYTHLVKKGILTLQQMAERMSLTPASVLHHPGGSLSAGAPADLCIMDLEAEEVIDPALFLSKGKNTPFAGYEVCGRVVATLKNGKFVYAEAI